MPVSSASPLVELDRTVCRAGASAILGPLTFSLRRGECVGVIGPNGAGKTTLLGLMNATVRPSSGHVRVFGMDPWTLSESDRCGLRTRIATVLQRNDYNPMTPLSTRAVVAMGRLGAHGLWGRISTSEEADIDAALARFGLAHMAARAYRSLSGGEQQKVQLARALIQSPECLLLDEPTSGLDVDWQERLVELIEELGGMAELSIVMTTHAIHHLPRSCRRVILLQKGDILFDGEPQSALTPEHIGALFHCPVDIVERDGRRYCMGTRSGEARS